MTLVKKTHVDEKNEWRSIDRSISNRLTATTLNALYNVRMYCCYALRQTKGGTY